MNATDRVTGGVLSAVRRLAVAMGATLLAASVCLSQAPSPDASLPPHGRAGKVFVADIVPRGLQNFPTARVTALMKTRVGSEYSKAVLEDDIRTLYKTNAFANIQVQTETTADGNVNVYIDFRELPSLVQDIVYQGAKHFSPDELDKVTGIRRGVPLNPIANRQACYKIQQQYAEKSRLLANVDLVEGGNPGDTRVVFNITEGPKVRVKSIAFTGVHFVSSARLMTQVTTSRAFLGLLGGSYNPMMIDADIGKIEEYYHTWGFHDVRVSRELVFDPDQRYVHLVFHVDEGTRYKVANIDVLGESTLPREQLLGVTKEKVGEFLNDGVAKQDIERIKAVYGYRGNDAIVTEQVVYLPNQPGQVDIHYEVQERPPATVGQIIICGNTVTKQNVILRQIPLYPGQVLTYPDIRQAERNLQRLGIFESKPEEGIRPTVSVIEGDPNNPVKDILVQVQETPTGSLMFGVGVNSDAGLTGSVVLNERNFDISRPPTSFEDLLSGQAWRGAGQEFRIEAVPGTQLQRYTASFKEPSLFDSPYSFGVSGYYYDRNYNEDIESRLGIRFTLGRKLNQYWSASVFTRIEDVSIHDVVDFAPPDYQNVVGSHFLLGVGGTVARDTRDSYLRATEGNLLSFTYEEVTGDFTFPVFTVEDNQYWTLYQRPDQSGRHVLAYHGEMAITTDQAPVYERFYAGGFRSMRGFEFRGVGPDIEGFKVGGDFMLLNSLEYQVPILANDQLYAVAFCDTGTVESSVEIRDYRVSVGFGLRIVVPMMGPLPIALDFGFPIVKGPADNEQVFSFWVGFFH